MIRIFLTGAHAERSPFSYPALAPLWADFAELTKDPGAADLYLFTHVSDVGAPPRTMVEDWRARRRIAENTAENTAEGTAKRGGGPPPVVILSEEPFWDTIWGRRPLAGTRVIDTDFGALPVVQLNHHTCGIFDFDRIPYYLLSDHRFANAYAARFARNAALTPTDWQTRFAARATNLTFMFERRPEPLHNMVWHEGDIIGLCAWRTELAETCARGMGTRPVALLGQSWQGGPTRFELTNWHRDKLTRLDGRTRLMGAFENTHQPNYLTEKLFDAFACGAWPLYYASPGHHVHKIGLPAASWSNLYGLTPQDAAARIAALRITPDMFVAYARAQAVLARLFGDPGAWVGERRRLARALKGALQQVLDTGPDSRPG